MGIDVQNWREFCRFGWRDSNGLAYGFSPAALMNFAICDYSKYRPAISGSGADLELEHIRMKANLFIFQEFDTAIVGL